MIKKIKTKTKNNKNLDYVSKFRLSNTVIESTNSQLYTILNNVMAVTSRYELSVEEVLCLIYLYELGVFSLVIKFQGREFRLGSLMDKGFVKEDYSYNNRKLYSLSDKGFDAINLFNKADHHDPRRGLVAAGADRDRRGAGHRLRSRLRAALAGRGLRRRDRGLRAPGPPRDIFKEKKRGAR